MHCFLPELQWFSKISVKYNSKKSLRHNALHCIAQFLSGLLKYLGYSQRQPADSVWARLHNFVPWLTWKFLVGSETCRGVASLIIAVEYYRKSILQCDTRHCNCIGLCYRYHYCFFVIVIVMVILNALHMTCLFLVIPPRTLFWRLIRPESVWDSTSNLI